MIIQSFHSALLVRCDLLYYTLWVSHCALRQTTKFYTAIYAGWRGIARTETAAVLSAATVCSLVFIVTFTAKRTYGA